MRDPLALRVSLAVTGGSEGCADLAKPITILKDMRADEAVAHHDDAPVFCKLRRQLAGFDLPLYLGESDDRAQGSIAVVDLLTSAAIANNITRWVSEVAIVAKVEEVPLSASSLVST